MRSDHFLHCRDCEDVFRPSSWDRAPVYAMTSAGVTETPRDDCMDFLTRHARHRLETLRPTAAGAHHTAALWDATAPTFWEASSGERTVVIEGTRTKVGAPLRYRLRAGRVVADRIAVEIPHDDLRRQVDEALYPGVAPDRKLTAFVASFKEIVWSLDPTTFEVLYDVPGDPTVSVAKLPPAAMAKVLDTASRVFDGTDADKIGARLAGTADDPDGLTVLVRQRVRVEG
jgi:hypothetical protein